MQRISTFFGRRSQDAKKQQRSKTSARKRSPWEDTDELKELKKQIEKRQPLLLYGFPGTGKSALSKALKIAAWASTPQLEIRKVDLKRLPLQGRPARLRERIADANSKNYRLIIEAGIYDLVDLLCGHSGGKNLGKRASEIANRSKLLDGKFRDWKSQIKATRFLSLYHKDARELVRAYAESIHLRQALQQENLSGENLEEVILKHARISRDDVPEIKTPEGKGYYFFEDIKAAFVKVVSRKTGQIESKQFEALSKAVRSCKEAEKELLSNPQLLGFLMLETVAGPSSSILGALLTPFCSFLSDYKGLLATILNAILPQLPGLGVSVVLLHFMRKKEHDDDFNKTLLELRKFWKALTPAKQRAMGELYDAVLGAEKKGDSKKAFDEISGIKYEVLLKRLERVERQLKQLKPIRETIEAIADVDNVKTHAELAAYYNVNQTRVIGIRQVDLDGLKASFSQVRTAISNGQGGPRVLLLAGDPGVGKSWLAFKLISEISRPDRNGSSGLKVLRLTSRLSMPYLKQRSGKDPIVVIFDDGQLGGSSASSEVFREEELAHFLDRLTNRGKVIFVASMSDSNWNRVSRDVSDTRISRLVSRFDVHPLSDPDARALVTSFFSSVKGSYAPYPRLRSPERSQGLDDETIDLIVNRAEGNAMILGLFFDTFVRSNYNRGQFILTKEDIEKNLLGKARWYVLNLISVNYFQEVLRTTGAARRQMLVDTLALLSAMTQIKVPFGVLYTASTHSAPYLSLPDGLFHAINEQIHVPLFEISRLGVIRPYHSAVTSAVLEILLNPRRMLRELRKTISHSRVDRPQLEETLAVMDQLGLDQDICGMAHERADSLKSDMSAPKFSLFRDTLDILQKTSQKELAAGNFPQIADTVSLFSVSLNFPGPGIKGLDIVRHTGAPVVSVSQIDELHSRLLSFPKGYDLGSRLSERQKRLRPFLDAQLCSLIGPLLSVSWPTILAELPRLLHSPDPLVLDTAWPITRRSLDLYIHMEKLDAILHCLPTIIDSLEDTNEMINSQAWATAPWLVSTSRDLYHLLESEPESLWDYFFHRDSIRMNSNGEEARILDLQWYKFSKLNLRMIDRISRVGGTAFKALLDIEDTLYSKRGRFAKLIAWSKDGDLSALCDWILNLFDDDYHGKEVLVGVTEDGMRVERAPFINRRKHQLGEATTICDVEDKQSFLTFLETLHHRAVDKDSDFAGFEFLGKEYLQLDH